MTKAVFNALGKIFAAEIEDRLPFQSKAKIFKALADDGMVEEVTITLPGRFPVRVTGYVLTPRGHVLYCEACPKATDLFEIARGARVRITDDDFDRADLDEVQTTALISLMTDRGYTLGRSEDGRNEWWPPEREE